MTMKITAVIFTLSMMFATSGIYAQGVIFEEITQSYISENTPFQIAERPDGIEVIAPDGALVADGRVDAVKAFPGDMIAVSRNDRWDFVTADGSIPEWSAGYDDIRGFSEGLAPVKQGSAWSYIDTEGNVAIPGDFQNTRPFRSGVAAVNVRGKYGYIDRTGEFVIPPAFDEALDFSDGFAPVRIGRQWGYINSEGALVVEPIFEAAGYYTGDKADVVVDGRSAQLLFSNKSRAEQWPFQSGQVGEFAVQGGGGRADYSVEVVEPDSGHFQWLTPVDVEFVSQPEGVQIYLYTVWDWTVLKRNGIDPAFDDGVELQPYARGETSRTLQLFMDKYYVVGRLGDQNRIYSLDVLGPDQVKMTFNNE